MYLTYVARQPIFNRKQNTVGYELLFRDGESNAYPSHIEANRATYRLIIENFLSLGTNPAIKSSRCFINFPYQSLIRRLPYSLSRNKIIIEVLETCEPTDELLEAIKELHSNGYMIALDDFTLTPEWHRFLPFAHIIKLDIRDMGVESACELVREYRYKKSKHQFLAEKVETAEEFRAVKKAGFKFFQGFFFSRPEMIKTEYLGPEQIIALRLFHEVCKSEPNFERMETIISQDVSLSYQLLSFVNNQSTRLEVPISSFRQALIYLGQDKLKMFVSLVVASYVSSNKPRELYNLSLQRAQFCEQMSRYPPFAKYGQQGFMIGLLSIIDALFDRPLDILLETLPITDIVKRALLHREGEFGTLIAMEECFERADWQGIEDLCYHLKVSVDEVKWHLIEAQRWSSEVAYAG